MSEWSIVRHSKCRVRQDRGFESHSLRQKQKIPLSRVFLFFCVIQDEWDSNPKGHWREVRGASGSSNSRWFKPTEWGGAERQICSSKSV